MGRPTTLLERLCGHALSLGAQSIDVEYKDGQEWVFANKEGKSIEIANYRSSSADARELRGNLYAAAKKPVAVLSADRFTLSKSASLRVLARMPSR
jgi:predicted P-loop ATPase